MMNVDQQKIRERSEEIPDILLGTIFAMRTDLILDAIAQKNNISQDRRRDIERLVQYVILGFLSIRGLYDEIKELMQGGDGIVLPVYQEIDAKLFDPIRKDIEDNYLKFKVGTVDEANVQKPSVVSQINLKTPQPEGTVNLKKEDAGPKILAVGEPGAQNIPAPRPLIKQEIPTSSFGPSIIQKKQDVAPAARPAVPQQTGKDIFSLSPKDRWGIESENIVASRRIMGQPQDPVVSSIPSVSSPTPVAPVKASRLVEAENKGDALPVVEESRLPEIIPRQSRPAVVPPRPSEEKKITAPPPISPLQNHPFSFSQETERNLNTARPSPSASPAITVNVHIDPESGSLRGDNAVLGRTAASVPTENISPSPAAVANPLNAPGKEDAPTRPMQWAAPAQPVHQPDVVVEIRHMQENGPASAGPAPLGKQAEDKSLPIRPMKTASPIQSAPPTNQITKEGGLTAAPMGAARQPSVSSRPLDPNEAIDIGPVIIHKHDDPSVAHMASGAQYKDLSSGGFFGNFSAQIPRQNAAPSVADVQIPAAAPGSVPMAHSPSAAPFQQQSVGGYQQMATPPAPQKKGGFFSFFKK